MKLTPVHFNSELEAAQYAAVVLPGSSSLLLAEIEDVGKRKFLLLPQTNQIACIIPKTEPQSIDPSKDGAMFKAIRDVSLFSVSGDPSCLQVEKVAGEYLLYKPKNKQNTKIPIPYEEHIDRQNKYFQREAANLYACKQAPHLLQIVDVGSYANSKDVEKVVLIVPKHICSLKSALKEHHPPSRNAFVASFLEGVSTLHEKAKRIHRDLKPANLLIHLDGTCVIADFGSAASSESWDKRTAGTPNYYSPEMAAAEIQYNEAKKPTALTEQERAHKQKELLATLAKAFSSPQGDLFATGKILYELRKKEDKLPNDLFPKTQFTAETLSERASILREDHPHYSFFHTLPTQIQTYADLVQSLLQRDPAKRLSAKEALEAFSTFSARPEHPNCKEDAR